MATGTVKFFNAAKGFGFIAPRDGSSDVFVHISAVERSGLSGLQDGDEVSYELEHDRRSGKLAAVDLTVSGYAPRGERPARSGEAGRSSGRDDRAFRPRDRAAGGAGEGVVKWFNGQKGFGFIPPSDGSGDVFVHISAVERAGLSDLREGQLIAYEIEQDRRTGKSSATNLRIR